MHSDQSKKKAKIKNRYNQVPHLTQDTVWESDKKHKKNSHTREPRGQPFPNRWPLGCKEQTWQYGKTNTNNKYLDPQKKMHFIFFSNFLSKYGLTGVDCTLLMRFMWLYISSHILFCCSKVCWICWIQCESDIAHYNLPPTHQFTCAVNNLQEWHLAKAVQSKSWCMKMKFIFQSSASTVGIRYAHSESAD